ncbi:MAG: hypothetical protein EHM72_12200 [Calditrichaeota bacterium]|nr:MAG: hypothetical protein EHM72_12200 [Calditrichota bacterium]
MVPQVSQDNFLQKDGRLWMTAETLSKLIGYSDSSSIRKILNRNKEELEPFKGYPKVTHPQGGEQSSLAFDEQGCYIVAMLARTDQAREFRRALARFLAEMREKHETVAEQYLRMSVKLEKAGLAKMLANHNLRMRDAERIRSLRPHLSVVELAKIYNLSVSVMEKLLMRIRRADGDFADHRPEHLKKLSRG